MIHKYRAWDIEEKRMRSVFEVTFHPDTFEPISARVGYAEKGSLVTKRLYNYPDKDPSFILMQSTGLLDKNGKEIYEGDRIRQLITMTPEKMYEDKIVVCEPAKILLQNKDGSSSFLCWPITTCLEVIGTIHDKEKV